MGWRRMLPKRYRRLPKRRREGNTGPKQGSVVMVVLFGAIVAGVINLSRTPLPQVATSIGDLLGF